jgi:hypothetical protein
MTKEGRWSWEIVALGILEGKARKQTTCPGWREGRGSEWSAWNSLSHDRWKGVSLAFPIWLIWLKKLGFFACVRDFVNRIGNFGREAQFCEEWLEVLRLRRDKPGLLRITIVFIGPLSRRLRRPEVDGYRLRPSAARVLAEKASDGDVQGEHGEEDGEVDDGVEEKGAGLGAFGPLHEADAGPDKQGR